MIRPIVNKRRQAALQRFAQLLQTRRKRKGRRNSMVGSPGGAPATAGNKLQGLAENGLKGQMMNNGGEQSLPPIQGNPFSPTGGNGMDNLNNMIKRNRPEYY